MIIKQGKKHKITVYFSGLPNSETYLVFKNSDYQDIDTKTWQSEPKDIVEITITCRKE